MRMFYIFNVFFFYLKICLRARCSHQKSHIWLASHWFPTPSLNMYSLFTIYWSAPPRSIPFIWLLFKLAMARTWLKMPHQLPLTHFLPLIKFRVVRHHRTLNLGEIQSIQREPTQTWRGHANSTENWTSCCEVTVLTTTEITEREHRQQHMTCKNIQTHGCTKSLSYQLVKVMH